MILMRDVHKFLGGRQVLRGLNLEVRRGETLVIIGRSGEGKSVSIKHIVGLLRADKGDVVVDGINMTTATARQVGEVRTRCGLLFQNGALLNWLTVAENVALPLVEHRLASREEARAKALEKLSLVDMSHAADNLPDEISGGMRKRVSLARAIVREPQIVLYDEPTSGLDPVLAAKIDELIIRAKEKLGITSIVVTHDMASAYRISDRIAMLYDGEIIEVGTPDEIRNTTSPIVRQFIEGSTHGPIEDAAARVQRHKLREGSGRWKKGLEEP